MRIESYSRIETRCTSCCKLDTHLIHIDCDDSDDDSDDDDGIWLEHFLGHCERRPNEHELDEIGRHAARLAKAVGSERRRNKTPSDLRLAGLA